jgi:hypothetical protein
VALEATEATSEKTVTLFVCWFIVAESTVRWFVVREKYC